MHASRNGYIIYYRYHELFVQDKNITFPMIKLIDMIVFIHNVIHIISNYALEIGSGDKLGWRFPTFGKLFKRVFVKFADGLIMGEDLL